MILRRGYEFTTGYRLQEYLGKGQFGEVWRATGPGGVMLAVKFIDLEGGRGQKEYEAIKRIKSIRHANLMPITAIWKLDAEGQLIPEPHNDGEQTIDAIELDTRGQSGFVVAAESQPATLIVGMSLGDASLEKYLPEKGDPNPQSRIPVGELLKFMEGIARGMDFLNSPIHDFGKGPVSLQHCDVKPANIVLIGDSAVLCDFGLARILSRNQVTMTNPSGTPAYMSPEAIDGKPSRTSDQYSLAVTYYHLRTGTLPISDESVHRVLQAHMTGRLDFSRLNEPEQAVLRRATHRDWRNRYESNSHFIGAVREALVKSGIAVTGQLSHPFVETPRPGKKIVPGPSGPAAQGVETFDQENLTGGVVQHSKGGSPILTDDAASKASYGTWVPGVPTNQTADLQPKFESAEVRAAMGSQSAGGPASHELASPPDAFLFGESKSDAPRAKRFPTKITLPAIGVTACVLLIGGIWMTRSPSGEEPSGGGEQVIVAPPKWQLSDDVNQSKANFESLVEANPALLTVNPEITFAHRDAIEVLVPLGKDAGFLTAGYDSTPKIWSVVKKETDDEGSIHVQPSELAGVVLDDIGSSVLYSAAVCLSEDAKWLFVGAGESLFVWPTQSLLNVSSSDFPVSPTQHWVFESNVLAVTSHPEKPQLAAVALEQQQLVVVDAQADGSPSDLVHRTELSDIPKSLRFTGAGNVLLLQFEYGDLAALKWSDMKGSDTSSASVPVTQLGVKDCEVLFGDPRSAEREFWIGHASGVLTKHRVTLDDGISLDAKQAIDSIAQDGISTIALAKHPSTNDSIMLVGSTDQSVSLIRLADQVTTQMVPLYSGPVRSVVLSADGSWFAAGTDRSVWVGSANDPAQFLTRLEIGPVSAESLLIDETNDLLIVGCGDGTLARFNWTHARLRSLVPSPKPAPAAEPKERAPTPPNNRITYSFDSN
ncbi:serine/threonine-protein kinase [Aporhodopirellula aestuarii]|uniref:Serine/threonine protein kinase n=1 Tax=Aporhodopirellula aestuarii TaxID=2950107 RepID=A0ABT0UDG8_9BACT|nr:serine/threonine-protein kinase [Aporhodopirellula aestuarii]MCM2374924.1 serine/threonine protein kinase [Aporhodopirellula aestuarii]